MLARSVLIVEDNIPYRDAVARTLTRGGRFRVVGEATTAYEALQLAERYRPRIVLLDVCLPGITGLCIANVLRRRYPGIAIVVLSMVAGDVRLLEALRSGATAYLTKDIDGAALVETLLRIAAGEHLLFHELMARPELSLSILAEFQNLVAGNVSGEDGLEPLSPREIEVLDCLAIGWSNRRIGDALFITERTVKNHITAILRKLDVHDRGQAIRAAERFGWTSPEHRLDLGHAPLDLATPA
ncbi:MAG: response regulator transcription factor [Thermomicrobiales bacterium]